MTNFFIDPPYYAAALFIIAVLLVLWRLLPRADFLTLVGATLFSFLAAEGMCRLLNIGDPRVAIWLEERLKDEIYPYKPNSDLIYIYPDNPRQYFDKGNKVTGRINKLGFRGKDTKIQKPAGITRILFTGDSFTLGMGVRDEHTLPVQFDNALKEKGFTSIETLNFGVTASNTAEQIVFLENYAIRFQPDVVILVVFLNDANRRGISNFISRSDILRKYRRKSYFINAFAGGIERMSTHQRMVRHYREGYEEDSDGWQSIQTSLKKAKSLSNDRGFELFVSVYPALYSLDDNYPFKEIHAKLNDFCSAENIAFIDLLGGFIGQTDKEMWVHRTDQHPNEVAHALAADFLAEKLVQESTVLDAIKK